MTDDFDFGGGDSPSSWPTVSSYVSRVIWKNDLTITKATPIFEATVADGDDITYSLGLLTFDANDVILTTTWYPVTNNTEIVFDTVGTGLKWKAEKAGMTGSATYVTYMECSVTETT